MIITANRNFEDWGTLFGDKVISLVIIDRIVHQCNNRQTKWKQLPYKEPPGTERNV